MRRIWIVLYEDRDGNPGAWRTEASSRAEAHDAFRRRHPRTEYTIISVYDPQWRKVA